MRLAADGMPTSCRRHRPPRHHATWTPGANAERHWTAGGKQSDKPRFAVWAAAASTPTPRRPSTCRALPVAVTAPPIRLQRGLCHFTKLGRAAKSAPMYPLRLTRYAPFAPPRRSPARFSPVARFSTYLAAAYLCPRKRLISACKRRFSACTLRFSSDKFRFASVS